MRPTPIISRSAFSLPALSLVALWLPALLLAPTAASALPLDERPTQDESVAGVPQDEDGLDAEDPLDDAGDEAMQDDGVVDDEPIASPRTGAALEDEPLVQDEDALPEADEPLARDEPLLEGETMDGALEADREGALATGAEPAVGLESGVVRLDPVAPENLAPARLSFEEDTIQLSLDQAVEIALQRNLGLVIERYNWIQSRTGVLQALGIYDTLLTANGAYSDSTSPSAEVVEGVPVTTRENQFFGIGVEQLVPTGGLASISTGANRTESNSRNLPLNPLFDSDFNVQFVQPLLRNFGRLPTERGLMIARVNADRARDFFEVEVAQLLVDVEEAYWNLVEARNQYVVAEEALRLAQVLDDQNRVRVEVGTLAPLELIQSEAGIANREGDIIQAEAGIGDAEDRLRRLLNLQDGELWNQTILPTTDPETDFIEIDLQSAIETAFMERPEVRAQLRRIETLEIDADFFENQLLPRLDLTANYGYSGLAGEGFRIDPVTGDRVSLDGGIGDAYDQIIDRDFDAWSLRLVFAYPIQNREARAQKAIADFGLEQGLAELTDLKQQIMTDVRTAARRVETAAKQIEASSVSRRLEEQNLDAERKRYENGLSSSFQILQIQEDLTQARSREVQAITSYRRALASYYRSVGRLLEVEGVELDTVDEPVR